MQQNATENETLVKRNQEIALNALLNGFTVVDAAELAEVDRSTVYRWMAQDPFFKQQLHALRQQRWGRIQEQLEELTGQTLTALRSVIEDPKSTHIARLRAAQMVLKALQPNGQ